jgi:quercetin dioxygenase-like cupin family protein
MNASDRRHVKVGLALWTASLGLMTLVALAQQEAAPGGRTPNLTGEGRFVDSSDMRASRLVFEAGARTHWHKHSHRQLLLIEEGLGRVQDRGEPIGALRASEPFYTKADVWHWHGAAPDQGAVQFTVYAGTIEWGDPVTDEEYLGR